MTYELVAILDAPKSSGMGMHGVLLRDPDGLVTSGLRSNRRVSQHEYAELLDGGHVLPVEGELPVRLLGSQIADAGILWVGDEFAERASELGLEAPIPPQEGTVSQAQGRFWSDLPPAIFATTQLWLKNGLRRLLATERSEFARLMLNVDATSEFTRAAVLHTSDDEERDLRWFVRLDNDAGLATDSDRMRLHLESLVTRATAADGMLIALVAHANRGSHKIGAEIASASSAKFCPFRPYFRSEALRLFNGDDRTAMVHAGEIVTTYRCPEAIIESAVLSTLRPSVSGVESAIVDGLRHKRILEALRKVPTVKVQTATISGTPVVPTSGIEPSMPQVEIERSDTETEIEDLARDARYTLPRDMEKVTRTLLAV
jgi:hypothetical protein